MHMNIGIIGYGGMGQAVAQSTEKRGHRIGDIIRSGDQLNKNSVSSMDVVLECAIPDGIEERVEKLCSYKKDFVIVTTGWYDHKDKFKEMVEESGVRCMYSPNFSIGVNLYYKIIDYASGLFNKVGDYDIWATEIHHKMKRDSPSGTAKKLSEIILENIDRKTDVIEDALQRKIEDHEFHFSSTRGGLVNFGHTIGFDSEVDCIEIKHSARSRMGYADGVISCAEWLVNQKPGFYSMEDYLHKLLSE